MNDLYYNIIKKSSDGILVLAPLDKDGDLFDFEIKYANPAFQRMIAEKEGILFSGKKLKTDLYETFSKSFIHILFKNSGNDSVTKDISLLNNDQEKWYRLNINKLDKDLVLLSFTNITSLKADQNRLNETLVDVQRLAKMGTFEWNVKENKMIWSEELYRIYGHEPTSFNVTAETALTVIHPEDQQKIADLFQSSTGSFYYKFRFIRKDGTEGFAYGQTKFVYGDDGKVIKVIGFTQDITERVKLQNLLLESQDIARLGSCEWDFIKNEITGTSQFFKILNIEQKPITLERFMAFVHPEDLGKLKKRLEVSLQNSYSTNLTYRICLSDGSEKFINSQNRSFRNREGKVVRMVGTIHDVTELEKAKRALTETNSQLEQRIEERTKDLSQVNEELRKINEELDKFAYTISHDLKSPLNSIAPLLKFIRKESGSNMGKDSLVMLDMINERLVHMNTMITQILESARNTNKFKEFINLNEILDSVVSSIYIPSDIDLVIDTDLPEVKYHKVSLLQVFQNLLSNAVKFMDKERGVIKIYSNNIVGGYQIFIEDNGPGIKAEDQNRIFEKFQVGHSNEYIESTGLGLSIVKDIVEEHGGVINIFSEEGKGAIFSFTIPF